MKTHIITPTNDLAASLSFYKSLNFKVVSKENPVVVTDGKVVIEIHPDKFIRPGIKVFSDSLAQTTEKLNKLTPVIETDNGHILQDPTGTTIYLTDQPFHLEVEKVETSFSILGNFAGLSLETTDPNKVIAIWKLLGFTNETR